MERAGGHKLRSRCFSRRNGKWQFDTASGSLVVREIEFSGLREQADDAYFEEEFEEPGKIISFANTTSNTALSFTVPQGTYSLIRIDLEAESDEYNTIQFLGSFIQSNGEELPFLLELEELRFDDKVAKNSQGNTEINLVSGVPAHARILLQPSVWFSTISVEDHAPSSFSFDDGILDT